MITAQIRDIAIIVVAVQSIVIGVLIAVLIFQLWRLMKVIKSDIQPIIKDTQETIGTVRGTATFMSENVVSPVMKTQGLVAGARRTAQVLGSGLRLGSRSWRRSTPRSATADGGSPTQPAGDPSTAK